MRRGKAPELESRRAADFERELLGRARAWIPSWSLDESEPDFGLALLKIAARFNSEVAERLDLAGDKMALGFLDWLGLRAEAARPARMPVVFRLAEAAREPVTAPRPAKMQVDVGDATVTFETETDVRIVPGRLDAVVAVDPANDAYFLPPPGLSSLDPLEPLPTVWRLKGFAPAGSTLLQLDPGLGLAEEMLIEIAGLQYRILKAKDDLVTIDSPVPAGGFAAGTRATKVEAFRPFDGARNRQAHILYVGDPDLLNVEAAARIELRGLPTLPGETAWEYWGKNDDVVDPDDSEPRWRPLELEAEDDPESIIVRKPKGALEPTRVGTADGRWIRASLTSSSGPIATDKVSLRINPREDQANPPPALTDPTLRSELPPVEVIVNTTPSPIGNFYLLGREPRLLDTLYVGSAEAFSKAGAKAWIMFALSDGVFSAMTAFDGWLLGRILAGVDREGALHLFTIGANGELARLGGGQPLQPSGSAGGGDKGVKLTSSGLRPAIWLDGFEVAIAVVAGDQVWVRIEAPLFLGRREWQSWGPIPSDDPDAPIDGLVATNDGGTKTVVALRNGKLFKSVRTTSPDWVEIMPNLGADEVVVGIAGLRDETLGAVANRFLVIAEKTTNQKCALYGVTADGTTASLLADVARDVVPFGIERAAGTLDLVAVKEGAPRQLWAKSGANPAVTASLEPQMTIDATALDGHLESGRLVVYGLAKSGAEPILLSWLPFDVSMAGIVFLAPIDSGQGGPNGPVAISPTHAFLPGRSRGEVFAAALGQRKRFLANAAAFKSALVHPPPAPALAIGDSVLAVSGTNRQRAKVSSISPATNIDALTGAIFYWLDDWIDRDTQSGMIFTYATSGPGIGSTVQANSATESTISTAAQLQQGELLIVRKGAAGTEEVLVEVTTANPNDAVVRPALGLPSTTPIAYFTPGTTNSPIFPALELDGSNNGWDSNLLRTSDLFFRNLDPKRQHPIAYAPDPITPSQPQWIALESPWNQPVADTEFIVGAVVSGWTTARTDTSTNPALAWEYWNGTGWWRLEVDDETSNFRNSGVVSFEVPDDLQATDWAGKTNHWVRARLIGGDYGQEKVKVITKPIGNNQTEQTVERTTEGIQPPYALDVRVAYAVDQDAVPRFLATEDSGTRRDQSEANRTPGAGVEIFTPLAVALARLDAAAAESTGDAECLADCDCPTGTASASPSPPPAAIMSRAGSGSGARAGRRALYLGFTAKLLGEPINLLFLAGTEANYDGIAPLVVDALIGDRFLPIVAADETRALGESGLLKMAFNVEPLQAELFGRTLAWLRLTPTGGDTDWKPALAGVHPNAVWARAAETMTRELLGSSEGQPLLTLNVARPPLLGNSLELRVREPLGQEEREALLKQEPERVKHGISDLPGDWVLWKQVGDPVDCGPADRVYALDEATGVIRFGDGRHGAIPPAGTDSIVAFLYERTEPAVGGTVPANFVNPRTELNLVTPVESVETVFAAGRSAGGVAPEPPERVLKFAPASLRHRGRAVSARDFEDLVRQRSSEVVQARCFARNGRVGLVVVMRGANPWPSQAQQRELRRMLLEIAPPSLAATGALSIGGPRVRRLRLELVLRVRTLDVAGTVAKQAKDRLVARFDTEHGGERGEGWPLGSDPREDDIAETLLDLAELDGIASISLAEVDELAGERPWRGAVGPRELVMLAPGDIGVGFEVVEAVG